MGTSVSPPLYGHKNYALIVQSPNFLTARLHARDVRGVCTYHVNSTNRLPAQYTGFVGVENMKNLYRNNLPPLYVSYVLLVFDTT